MLKRGKFVVLQSHALKHNFYDSQASTAVEIKRKIVLPHYVVSAEKNFLSL
jgi:hypothetical protein